MERHEFTMREQKLSQGRVSITVCRTSRMESQPVITVALYPDEHTDRRVQISDDPDRLRELLRDLGDVASAALEELSQ